VYLLDFHAYINEMHGSKSKIPNKNFCLYIHDFKFMAFLGTPYIYDISRLRVKCFLLCQLEAHLQFSHNVFFSLHTMCSSVYARCVLQFTHDVFFSLRTMCSSVYAQCVLQQRICFGSSGRGSMKYYYSGFGFLQGTNSSAQNMKFCVLF
jgi:hypothetical protein